MILKSVVAVYLFLLFVNVDADGKHTCKLAKMSNNEPPDDHVALNKLKPLVGKVYSAEDTENKFSYTIGICHDANVDYPGAGVVQRNLNPNQDPNRPSVYTVGKYTSTEIMSGNDWIMLEYGDGDAYGSHCNHEKRRAVILLICDETADDSNPQVNVLEENSNKTSDCYYLFEISHKSVCGIKTPIITFSLSIGSIFLITLACLVALYLLLGFAYQRFVLGAKGMEQIPNYSFWQDFGNLQADGCNLVCRSMSKKSPTYKGIGDEQLEDDLDRERDDHLLPM